jgi:hypothetical protein
MIREGDHVIVPEGVMLDEQRAQVAESHGYFETVGAREAELLMRARESSSQGIVLTHGRGKIENRERMAARRLIARGLLTEPNAFGGPGVGWLYRYTLTLRGRMCWLRVLSD